MGTPFLLSPSFAYDRELNEFFYSADMLSTRMSTRVGYAGDLVMFFNFLYRGRGVVDWRDATETDHRAYLLWRRQDPHGPLVSGRTWDREVSAQNRFFRWQFSRSHVAENPIPQRHSRPGPRSVARSVEQTAATYSHDARREHVHWLPAASYRTWRDVGVRGYTTDALPDPSFRGRWAARNAAFTDLMVRTGLRLTEQASLLAPEIPSAPTSGYNRFWLGSAVAKWGSERWIYAPASVLREIAEYVRVDRRDVIESARARGRYEHSTGPLLDPDTGVVTTRAGGGLLSRTRIANLPPSERARIMGEAEGGAEPAALWLTEDGAPVSVSPWKDLFRQANDRCAARGLALRAHAHLLRHTFAVLTLEQLQRGHIAALAGLKSEQRTHYVRVFGDPLDWVRRALGHRSVTTTQIYLHALEELELETRLALIPDGWDDPRAPRSEGRA
ncbi:site-specific integrase [Microbacterium arborescens]|uniref:site-specific integrase n=1 Tax=Microbacterium arborescens TaxID=33883 RepID=UPI0025A069FA|nr:site-specific integrase [Microbacterium arborescens]WJM17161.1 site-specific integrase [Microbacterium arborescens]